MSGLIDYWNNNTNNYSRAQLSAVMPYLVYGNLNSTTSSQHYYNIYKLEIGNVIYDGSLF